MMKKLLVRFCIVFCFFIILLIGLVLFTPEPASFSRKAESSKIFDRNGVLLYEILIPEKGKQDFVKLEKISPYLLDAIIAIEDQDFYNHYGIDFTALMRASWQNAYYGEIISGASTLEQQLARNLFNHQERTYLNKFKEIALALKLNLKYEKNEILEKYLNTVYFGNLAYGIEAASQTYFGKTSAKLNLAESSFLAGLPQSPSAFSPYVDLQAGKKRQNKVLDSLLAQSKISQEDYESAAEQDLKFQKQRLVKIKAPHFVMWVLDQLEKEDLLAEISKGGYLITTTLDLGLQEEIQNLASLHLDKLAFKNITNASVVVLDQSSGELLAMLGSKDYFDEEIDGEVNVALSLRQPGSTLKPFLYAMAFENGLAPESSIVDEPVRFNSVDGRPYEPKNYDLTYHGLVTMREALAQSLNIPAVKILDYVGINSFLDKLHGLGLRTLIQSSEHYGLALALGSGEVRLFDLTQAYGVFGNGGNRISVETIKEVSSVNSESLGFRFRTSWNEKIFEQDAANQVTSILSDNYARTPAFGDDSPLKFDYPVAVKTGTSRNFRDNWTIGYTPVRTVGVWVGNSDGSPMIDSSGITGAAPLFNSIMNLVMRDLPKKNFREIEKGKKATAFEEFAQEKQTNTLEKMKEQSLIAYPYEGDIFQLSLNIPLEKQILTFRAKAEGEWFLNGELLGEGKTQDWQMQRGEYVLKFLTIEGEADVKFSVR